ncbi:hypothetical protein [Micromonospora sp. CB01531]|uniref:hypothetical protein n=1 Tax=Micromonospora sp. CB01531 TaxID=1718947 RepID=UPI00093FF875|nr:hypothetical protein [Micromonospora sp. CB01531]OKI47276.1 hypothetical protein A6A27_10540 [Micromonospora sp. CB01531]
MILYHFTCEDGAQGIAECGELRAFPQPLLGRRLIWLTDLDAPNRLALGLTSHTLGCDRTAYRVTVDVEAQRWTDYVRELPRPDRRHARLLAASPGALPMHWLVLAEPVPVLSVERAR